MVPALPDRCAVRDALLHSPLFEGAPAALLMSMMSGSETRELATGERLLSAGADNDVLFLVLAGSLSVHVPGTVQPHVRLGPGECAGELSLLDGLGASADVAADEEFTLVLAIEHEQLWTVMNACPSVARNLLRVLAGRVRHDDRALGEADRLQRVHEEAATIDSLTGLRNRRWLDDALVRQLHRARRTRRPLSVLMIDVDHFKAVNDEYGHLAGDEVLRHISGVLAGSLRPQDLLARFGGEEFAVVLPDADASQATPIAERLRLAVETAPPAPGAGVPPRVTVSVGVATETRFDDNAGPAALLDRADRALYQAKQAGRNHMRAS
jgi:diguanylate cyclase (GGDEF)-like protein